MKPIDVLLKECWFKIYEKEIIVNSKNCGNPEI